METILYILHNNI